VTGVAPECTAILANISAFLDGDLDATSCAAIEAHCSACPRCAAVVEGLKQTVGLCRSASAAPLPDAVRRRALDSIRRLLDQADER
jgi:anti-sigma factor RsiW